MEKNNAQEEIIHTVNGQLLVVACPGSGKTTTLLRRIHYMINEAKIPAQQILMVTFSSAAAKEMKTRYQKKFGMDAVTFSTIHSMCMSILKKFGGYTKESILSDPREYFYEVLRKQKGINDINEFITGLITEISVINNNSIDFNSYKPKCTKDKKLFLKLINGYQEYKEELHLIDFDDMLQKAYEIMVNDKECLDFLRNKYRYIQVDEYQDTNYIQRDIVYSLAGENGNLAVVGDDDQSIYMFRGAKPEIMLNFKKDYPNCKVIHMSTNYRSLQEIIQKADNLVQHNSQRFSKQFLGSRQEKGKVIFRNYLNSISQLGGVIHKIRSLLDDGIKPEQIAILYRTNKESMPFAEYFMNEKIPFQCNERLKSKYHHWIFQDIQAYQKLSRGKKDIIAFNRILNHPNRFFYGKAFRSVNPDLESLNQAIYMQSGKEYWKIQKGLKNAADLFRHLKVLSSLNPVEFMNYLYRAVGYDEYLKQYADLRKLDKKELTAIWNNLYDEAKLYGNWGEWGRHIMAYNRQLQQANKNKDGIMLSTMHRSKGLEWEYVFIINCINGTIPHTNATEFEDIEEERRLFYVAMTRAKDSLYLTAYKKDGEGDKETNVSPFIEECNI